MQNEKITDEQIINTLECGKSNLILENALALINRLKAEVVEKDEMLKAQADTIFLYERVIKDKNAEIERYKGVIKILENDIKNARARKVCGMCRFYADGICGSIHGMNGRVTKGDYCSHHSERKDVKDER